jgi:hypothetical protein
MRYSRYLLLQKERGNYNSMHEPTQEHHDINPPSSTLLLFFFWCRKCLHLGKGLSNIILYMIWQEVAPIRARSIIGIGRVQGQASFSTPHEDYLGFTFGTKSMSIPQWIEDKSREQQSPNHWCTSDDRAWWRICIVMYIPNNYQGGTHRHGPTLSVQRKNGK